MAVGAAALVLPSIAFADSECGAPAGGVVTCTSANNPYPNGITYIPSADLTVNVNSDVVINTSTTLEPGILLLTGDPTGNITLNMAPGAAITTTDPGAFGVLGSTDDGTLTLNTSQISTSGTSAVGVLATSSGTITVNAGTTYTSGDGAAGIEADGAVGDISVTAFTVDTSGSGADGIIAQNTGGDIDIMPGTVITTGSGSTGISASNLFGNINITGDAVETYGPGSTGVNATDALGDITVNLTQVQTEGDNSPGVVVSSSSGSVDVTVGTISTDGINSPGAMVTGGTTASFTSDNFVFTGGDNSPGIVVKAGTGAATVNAASVVTYGATSDAIDAESTSGPVTVTSGGVTTHGDNSVGVFVRGAGDVSAAPGSVTTYGANANGVDIQSTGGSVVVSGGGNITTSGDYSRGVDARDYAAGGNVTIDVGQVTTSGLKAASAFQPDSAGVFARTGTGAISVTTTGVTTAGYSAEGVNAHSQSGDVTVNGGAIVTTGGGSDGVTAYSNNGGNVSVTTSSVTTSGQGSKGIYAYAGGPGATVTVSGGDISTTGFNAAGITAKSGGDAAVTFGTVKTTDLFSDGIDATSIDGNVSVTGTSVSIGGVATYGVSAYADTGNVTVNVGTVTTASDAAGVEAIAPNGAVNVTVGSLTSTGANGGEGIYASGVSANVVSTGTISTVGKAAYGGIGTAVAARATTGNATVSVNNVSTTGDGAFGVDARSAGGGVGIVFTGAVTTAGKGATAIYANGGGAAGVSISNGAGSTGSIATTGYNSRGLLAYSNAGPINLTLGTVSTTGKLSTAVAADSGSGIVSITAAKVSTTGDSADGIDSFSNAAITVNSGSVSTAGLDSSGIFALSNADKVTINSGSISTTGADAAGIQVQGAQDVVVNSGSVTTTGADSTGIYAGSIGGNTTVHITGAGVTASNADAIYARGNAVVVTTAAGSVINGAKDGILLNAVTGSILTLAGTTDSGAGYAIDGVFGGPITVANSGTINGRVRLSPLADTINNTGTFNAAADSDFGAGTDTFNNAGTVNVLPQTGTAGTVTFIGLEQFNNSGLVSLVNGHAGDRFVLPGAFAGSGASDLAFDANLGAATQANCSAAGGAADCLSVAGAISGGNRIRVVDTATGVGASNTGGIVLVSAGSVAAGTSFTLDPTSPGYVTRGGQGAIDAGLFFYRLAPLGAGQVGLVSAPDNEVFEFADLGVAANDVWYTTTGGYFDRSVDVRQGLADQGGAYHPGVWLKMIGDWTRRDQSQSTNSLGTTFTFNTSYDQNTAVLLGGLDVLHGGDNHQAWVLGIDGGYVDSEINFRASPTRDELSGGVVGVYGTFVSGPFYVDATAADNFLTLQDNDPTLSATPGAHQANVSDARVSTWGGQVESGFRFGVTNDLKLEPFASLSYVQSHFSDLGMAGSDVHFNDNDSFRGSLGLRLISAFTFEGVTYKPALYGRAWDEWADRDSIEVSNPGAPVFAGDQFRGVFGDVGANISIFSVARVSGFINADYKWSNRYEESTASVGLSYRW